MMVLQKSLYLQLIKNYIIKNKMKNFCILFISIFLFSCKNEKTVEPVKEKNSVKITFGLIVKKDDKMHLYYTQDGTLNFDEKNTVWSSATGSDAVQDVVFELPEDVIPTHIRVDFGSGVNVDQSNVELKTFKINYFAKKFETSGVSILQYFYPMEANTKIAPGTATLERLNKNQASGPILYPHIALTNKLKEIIIKA
jgi:hypothetical protein